MYAKESVEDDVHLKVEDSDNGSNGESLKQKRSQLGQIGKRFREPLLSDDGGVWSLNNVATWIRQRTSSSSLNPFDDDYEDDEDKVKEAVNGVYSWIRKRAIAITIMVLSLTATILVFIFDPNNDIRTNQAIGLWIWTALPGMVIMVFLVSAIIEKLFLNLLGYLSSKQPNWIMIVVHLELRTYVRLILFTFALDEFILDWFNFYTGSPDAIRRIETLIRNGLRSVYIVALLLIVRNILLKLLEFSATKQSFRKDIQIMCLQMDTIERLFCRNRTEQEDLEKLWNENQDRKQFMYRVFTIRDEPMKLHLEQRLDEQGMRLGFSKVESIEIQSVKDMSQLAGFLFDDIATSVQNNLPSITLQDWRHFFADVKRSRRAFLSLFSKNPGVISSRAVLRNDFLSAWQNVFKSRSALSNQLKAAKNVYKLVESIAGALFWIVMLFVIASIFGFDVGQVVTAASAFVISFAFATSKSLSRVVESIMFVFVSHPYQVNDSIKIADKWFVVESIGILETRVRDKSNLVTRYSNAILADMDISNVVYSSQNHVVDIIHFQIAIDTRVDKLEKLRNALIQYTIQNPQGWKPGRVTIIQVGVTSAVKIDFEIRVESCIEWNDYSTFRMQDYALKTFLFETLMSLNLNWDLATQPVRLLEPKINVADPVVAS